MIYQNKLQCIRLVHATTNLFKISNKKNSQTSSSFQVYPNLWWKTLSAISCGTDDLTGSYSNFIQMLLHLLLSQKHIHLIKRIVCTHGLNHCMKFCIIKIGKNRLECIMVLAVTANCRHMQVQNMTFNSCTVCSYKYFIFSWLASALTLLVGRQEVQ